MTETSMGPATAASAIIGSEVPEFHWEGEDDGPSVNESNATGPVSIEPRITDWSLRWLPSAVSADEIQVDAGLIACAVSFRGTAHVLLGAPRQDAFSLASNDNSVVLAVCDGIGSHDYSHHGAHAATSRVAAAVRRGESDPAVLAARAADACFRIAEDLLLPARQVSTTLTVAVIARESGPDGVRAVEIHQIGDSPAFLLTADGCWQELTPGGANAEQQPDNVVRQWLPERFEGCATVTVNLPAGALIALASDGWSVPLGSGTGPLGLDLARRWLPGPRPLVQFVVDNSFEDYHDDRTVAVLWNPPFGAAPPNP